jgi:hypothetical protein
MENQPQPESARGIKVPYEPDSVLSPEVIYRRNPPDAIYYVTSEGDPVRVTFEKLDAIRACRGEYLPYESDDSPESGYSSVFIVENSRWLRERHAYEALHYRSCYEFGGDVDEMLTDYDQYLFRFHDEFVEAIAAGIWFEKDPEPFPSDPLSGSSFPEGHPLADLPLAAVTERFVVESITCQVRTNPKPIETILQGAYYCSQSLYHFALELNGSAGVDYRLDIRERRRRVKSVLRHRFGAARATIDGVATLEQAKALLEPCIRRASKHRRETER